MPNDIKVKFQNHYKLLIPFENDIIFENEIINQNIDYFKDENSVINFRYFFLDKDKMTIDSILKKNKISASIETLPIGNYEVEQRIQKFYLKIVFVVLIILLIIELLSIKNR